MRKFDGLVCMRGLGWMGKADWGEYRYPPDMIPGCHVTVHTSATNDRDARMLLMSMGIPFYGKFVD